MVSYIGCGGDGRTWAKDIQRDIAQAAWPGLVAVPPDLHPTNGVVIPVRGDILRVACSPPHLHEIRQQPAPFAMTHRSPSQSRGSA